MQTVIGSATHSHRSTVPLAFRLLSDASYVRKESPGSVVAAFVRLKSFPSNIKMHHLYLRQSFLKSTQTPRQLSTAICQQGVLAATDAQLDLMNYKSAPTSWPRFPKYTPAAPSWPAEVVERYPKKTREA